MVTWFTQASTGPLPTPMVVVEEVDPCIWGVLPSIVHKRFIVNVTALTQAINLVLNGVHQSVREIHDNLISALLPRIYGNAVVL